MTGTVPPSGVLPPFARSVLGMLSPRRFSYDGVVRIGPRRFLLADPEDVRHVLLTNAANYVKTPRLTSARGRRRAGEGLLTRTGEAHRERKRLLLPLFHRAAVARFGPALSRRIETWVAQRREGERIDLAEQMSDLTQSAILDLLFGEDHDDAARRRLSAAIRVRRRHTEHVYHGRLPLRERLPTPLVRAHRRALSVIDEAIQTAITRRRAGDGQGPALLGDLLAAGVSEGRELSDRDVRDEVLTLTSTGYETLGEALTWTWYLLARHPAVEAELRAGPEVVSAILHESLRLYPPTWIYSRIPLAADRLPSGRAVRKSATLYVCPYILHRHPAHYTDPERFDPGRFAAGRRPTRFVYLPFGDGPHRCLGEHLVGLEGSLSLAAIASRLRFRLLDARPAVPYGGITLRPKGGLPVQIERR